MRFDYTTVGHVTADVMADGTRRPGGSAFYSALQAARLGKRALIRTRGVAEEIERLLAPFAGELALELQEAPCTTSFQTSGKGRRRSQRVLSWAGPIEPEPLVDTAVLHLAPVARETPAAWSGEASFVGLTPQGLVRDWSEPDGSVVLRPLRASQLPERVDAAVLSVIERACCAALLDTGALVAVTDEAAPTELLAPDGDPILLAVPAVQRLRDDIGAGDVFAAAFFVALADGEDASAAAAFANAAAAVRLSGEGPDAIGDRASIKARVGNSG
ncbi:MAG TPA: PfkB family carbohydrate kinase [Solirubrobacteraceae bacterium]|nr:PfkB family carbohydrate kinase [Solirubrobacteraceae bacterium]